MKKIIVCSTLLVLIMSTTFSQQSNPSLNFTKQDYLQKSKKQKTCAWVLLGGGTALSLTGFFVYQHSLVGETADRDNNGYNPTGLALFFSGIGCMVGSIPLFGAASRNKFKALSLSLKNDSFLQIQKNSFVNRQFPSLSFKINL